MCFHPDDKMYWNGEKWYADRMDFPDGSACIIYEDGSIIVMETSLFYDANNSPTYVWCSVGPFSLN